MSGRTPGSRRRARRNAGLAAGAVGALLLLWTGCAVTEDNYELLTFFFDGVPDPHAPMLPGATAAQIRQSPTYSAHAPFTEDRCSECHERRFNLGPADSDMCLKCHEDVPRELPLMHGPVAAVACLWCHTAHESPYPALLKGEPRAVCSSCHDATLLSADRVPQHSPAAEQSCLDCHGGHGGTVRYFLHGEAVNGPPMAPLRPDSPPAERGQNP